MPSVSKLTLLSHAPGGTNHGFLERRKEEAGSEEGEWWLGWMRWGRWLYCGLDGWKRHFACPYVLNLSAARNPMDHASPLLPFFTFDDITLFSSSSWLFLVFSD